MKLMKTWVAGLLCLALCLGVGAGAEGYAGAITLCDCVGLSGESGPAICLERRLSEWQAAHPGIALVRTSKTGDEIAALALMERLPDVMLAPAGVGKKLARYGRALDLTDAVLNSEYAARYDAMQLMPFISAGGIKAFPALSRSSALMLYDPDAWTRAGLDGFPDGWDALYGQREALEALGYREVVGFGCAGGAPALVAVLGPLLLGDDEGWDWLQALLSLDTRRSFRETGFTDALDRAAALLSSGLFPEASQDLNSSDALTRFTQGLCPAVVVWGDALSALSRVKREAPELYARLEFAALPASDRGGVVPTGLYCGLFLRERLDDDPEKLSACLDLCRYLTGPAYADALASEYGMWSFTKADGAAWDAFSEGGDATVQRLIRFLNEDAETCPDLPQLLFGDLWAVCGNALIDADSRSAGEIANDMQDVYERYYFEDR